MSDKSANLIFKVIGVINLIIGIVYGFVVILTVFAKAISSFAEAGATEYGYLLEPIPTEETILFTVLLSVIMFMHLASGIGFLRMKKWQPMVFTILIFLGFLEFIFKIVSTGFETSYVITILFQIVWLAVVALTWSKKKLFSN